MQRDPEGYLDWSNDRQYCSSTPVNTTDPLGLFGGPMWYRGADGKPVDVGGQNTQGSSLGVKIEAIYISRTFWGSLLNGILGIKAISEFDSYDLNDDQHEMTKHLDGRVDQTYRVYLYQELDAGRLKLGAEWKAIRIGGERGKSLDAKELLQPLGYVWELDERGSLASGDTGAWLHGAHQVLAEGSMEARCVGGAISIRNRSVNFTWLDIIQSKAESSNEMEQRLVHLESKNKAKFFVTIPWRDDRTREMLVTRLKGKP